MKHRFLNTYAAGLLLVALLEVFAVILKWHYFNHTSYDLREFIISWLQHIREQGILHAYHDKTSNYPPLYLYFLGIGNLLFPTMPSIYLIKLVSIVGEVVAAYFVYRIVLDYRGATSVAPLIAAALVYASPSVILNGAAVGQSDIWYTAFLVATLYALIKDSPLKAMVYFGLAFSLKPQSMFLAPFLLICVIKRLIPLRFAWVPAGVYVLTLLPSWLEGRPFLDLLFVYGGQVYNNELGNGANFYYLFYNFDHNVVVKIGLCFSMTMAFLFSLFTPWIVRYRFPPYQLALLATASTAMMPFIIPNVLDRYFFASEMFALILVFMRPRFIFMVIFVLLQISEVVNLWYNNFQFFDDWSGLSFAPRQKIAASINLVAIVLLCFAYYRDIMNGKRVDMIKAWFLKRLHDYTGRKLYGHQYQSQPD